MRWCTSDLHSKCAPRPHPQHVSKYGIDIQSQTAENKRGRRRRRRRRRRKIVTTAAKYNGLPITKGGHNQLTDKVGADRKQIQLAACKVSENVSVINPAAITNCSSSSYKLKRRVTQRNGSACPGRVPAYTTKAVPVLRCLAKS